MDHAVAAMSGASVRRHRADRWRAGQTAAVESTIAFVAGLALLLGSLKLCMWFSQRYVTRQRGYDCTRVVATGQTRLTPWTPVPTQLWDGPSKKLNMFSGGLVIDDRSVCPPEAIFHFNTQTFDGS